MELPTRIAPHALDRAEPRRAVTNESITTIFSSRNLVVFVLLASIFTMTAGAITDPDFWWHLRTGQLICETHVVPRADVFSFTAQGTEWVTHEWLTEVVMYATYRAAGWGGLVTLFSLVMTAALWLAERRAIKRDAHQLVACATTLLAALATMPIWGVRPQMISFLFTSVFVFVLDDYMRSDETCDELAHLDQATLLAKRAPWLLVPLMLVWVNTHAGFALGLALVALACAGVALDELSDRNEKPRRVREGRAWARARPLCLIFVACVAVVPLNPSGPRLFSYPFETLDSRSMQYIIEWLSPNFHQPNAQAFALLLLATCVALALSPKRARPSDLLLLSVAAYASLRAWRNIPFFALVAAPLLAEHSWSFIKNIRTSHRDEAAETARREVASVGAAGARPAASLILNFVALVCVPLGLCALRVSSATSNQPAVEAEKYPAAAVEFLRGRPTSGHLFNAYGWGGYLVWKLYPERLVFIDGRADVYGDALLEEYLRAEGGEPNWRATLDKYRIGVVMIRPDAALASLLVEDAGWEKVYEDRQAVIFFKR
ncbi:MAG: hypothetical protein QOE33_1536 [Acidobacteriota bacterium]|nr:hypothetical protein [Acidobacteriota bacterium]